MDENKEVLIYELNFYVDEAFAQYFTRERNKLVASPVFAGLIAQSKFAAAYQDPHMTREMIDKITSGIALKAMLDTDFIKGLNAYENNNRVINAKVVSESEEEDIEDKDLPDNVINIFDYMARKRGEIFPGGDDDVD